MHICFWAWEHMPGWPREGSPGREPRLLCEWSQAKKQRVGAKQLIGNASLLVFKQGNRVRERRAILWLNKNVLVSLTMDEMDQISCWSWRRISGAFIY